MLPNSFLTVYTLQYFLDLNPVSKCSLPPVDSMGVFFCPLLQPRISLLNCCIIFIVVLLRMFYSLSLVTTFTVLNQSSRPVKGSSSLCVEGHSLSSLDKDLSQRPPPGKSCTCGLGQPCCSPHGCIAGAL